ncbi:GNS1/SUR4 family-domain-containing protein [Pelagophyceae sp. CCMP2097]|nr:GNS1/SUR4 family-domain-containing protein [Pelagophyceae sp. CCMP2097]
MAALAAWLPSWAEFVADLTPTPPFPETDPFRLIARHSNWQGYNLHFFRSADFQVFNGYVWSIETGLRWEVPLFFVSMYILAIFAAKEKFTIKVELRSTALCWNVMLSVFSMCGFLACAPVLFSELRSNGLYFCTCAHAGWYGTGTHGAFVAAFVYSKFFELGDTFLLLAAGRKVILLHWWHHATVLLFCWHSYSAQTSTGIWFASMNYGVHAVMYAYFAVTQTSFRKAVQKFAIYITLLQLCQMLLGISIIVRAILYQIGGKECNVNKTNSILGLAMYFSYFGLFLKLFLENYVFKAKAKAA